MSQHKSLCCDKVLSYLKTCTFTYFQPLKTNHIMQYSFSTQFILMKTHISSNNHNSSMNNKSHSSLNIIHQYIHQCIQLKSTMKLFTIFLLKKTNLHSPKLQLCIIIKEQVRVKEKLSLCSTFCLNSLRMNDSKQ